MNRYLFPTSPETLTEIGEGFVFEKGQIFRYKPHDDEYIVVVDFGDHVNAECDGGIEENGEVQYNACFWNCTPQGKPFRLREGVFTSDEGYTNSKEMRKYYFFIGKVAPQPFLDLLRKQDEDDKPISRLPIIERPKRQRLDEERLEEMRKYNDRMRAKLEATQNIANNDNGVRTIIQIPIHTTGSADTTYASIFQD